MKHIILLLLLISSFIAGSAGVSAQSPHYRELSAAKQHELFDLADDDAPPTTTVDLIGVFDSLNSKDEQCQADIVTLADFFRQEVRQGAVEDETHAVEATFNLELTPTMQTPLPVKVVLNTVDFASGMLIDTMETTGAATFLLFYQLTDFDKVQEALSSPLQTFSCALRATGDATVGAIVEGSNNGNWRQAGQGVGQLAVVILSIGTSYEAVSASTLLRRVQNIGRQVESRLPSMLGVVSGSGEGALRLQPSFVGTIPVIHTATAVRVGATAIAGSATGGMFGNVLHIMEPTDSPGGASLPPRRPKSGPVVPPAKQFKVLQDGIYKPYGKNKLVRVASPQEVSELLTPKAGEEFFDALYIEEVGAGDGKLLEKVGVGFRTMRIDSLKQAFSRRSTFYTGKPKGFIREAKTGLVRAVYEVSLIDVMEFKSWIAKLFHNESGIAFSQTLDATNVYLVWDLKPVK